MISRSSWKVGPRKSQLHLGAAGPEQGRGVRSCVCSKQSPLGLGGGWEQQRAGSGRDGWDRTSLGCGGEAFQAERPAWGARLGRGALRDLGANLGKST